jgi:VanZ family protein
VALLLLDIFMLACATELNQFFVENRSPLFTDVLIDMAGAGTGVLLSRNKVT